MRILIFREPMLPPAYLPRIRYFCAYFLAKGWDITLITENADNKNQLQDGIELYPIDFYKYTQGFKCKIEWLFKFILCLLFDYKNHFFYKKSRKFLAAKQFDLVFCSSCFTFPLPVAAKVANELNIPLFVDLRDIAEQSPDDNHYLAKKPPKLLGNFIFELYKKINVQRRNRVLKTAAGVTSVSPFHVETLSKYNANTKLLYNGFDESKFVPKEIKTDRFVISYFGRIFNEKMRNPRLLFEAVRRLNEKGLFSPENTLIRWFVDEESKSIIQKIAMEYDLQTFVECNDFISPEKLSEEMNKSAISLVLCNVESEKKYFGIMTTKFFEAVGTNRPVLCIPNNNDNLSRIIQETACGLVSSDVSEIEIFLSDKFAEWKKNNRVAGLLTDEVRMNFSRKKGAEILENLMLETLKKS